MNNLNNQEISQNLASHSMPAVVLGLGVNGCGVVRSLGRKGIPVIGIYTQSHEAGRFSRYCHAMKFPVLEHQEEAFLHDLLQLGEQLERPPLFPTSDEFLYFLSNHREELKKYYRFNISDMQTLQMIIKKNGTQELAERCGVPIPKTRYPQAFEEVEVLCREMNFPCIIKPLDTFSVKFPELAKNVIVINPDRLRTFYQMYPHLLEQSVIQEIIRGGDGYIFICAAYLDASSEPLATYTGRKIRQYPPDYGVTCLGESIYLPELEEMTLQFLKKIKFRGLVAAEYVRDRESGAFYFLELNARSYYHNLLFTDCGVNLAYVAYQDLLGEKAEPLRPRQKEGIKWLDFQRDLSSCWRKYKLREITWKEWLQTILQARSFAYFDRRDLKPYFYAIYLFVKILLRKSGEGFKRLINKVRERLNIFTRPSKSTQDRPIRVMHVVKVLGLAGMEYGVIKLVNQLDPKRFSPMICCLLFQTDAARPLLDSRIPVFELRKRLGRDLRMIFKIADLLRRERVDIVHSHNWPTFLYTVLAAWIARTPVVIHGEHGRDSQTVSHRQMFLGRWLAKSVNHVLTVCRDLSRELVEQWKIKPEQVSTIINGVDLETFGQDYPLDGLYKEFQLTSENRVILNIGGLRPIKDHPTLLRAFARVYQKLPETRLILVGSDHGTGTQAKLEKLAESLGILKVTYFAGIRHDVPQLLALCKVYVNSSTFEGMSNTILEAMAARKPVIATAVGGNPELVDHKVTGYLISAGNDQELAERLEQLLTDAELSEKLGTAGRQKVEQHHSMSSMIHNYSDLYEEIFWRNQIKQTRSLQERTKQWIARGLCWSGLNRLKEMADSAQLAILTYHRVLPLHKTHQYPFQGMMMARDLFEAQIAYLAKNYTVLGLPEAIRLLEQGQIPRRAVTITFDDGYRDNYEYAWPILKKYQVPATFFITTGFLDRRIHLWWDEVMEIVQQLSYDPNSGRGKERLLPNWMVSLFRKLQEGNSPQAIAKEIVDHLNRTSLQERQTSLEALREFANLDPNHRPDLMLTWEQVREMHRSGMHIGAHTVTHAFLDELEDREAQAEIEGSVQRLQEQLKTPIRLFSYPRGRSVDSLKRLLQQAGIEAAVTTEIGRNKPGTDLFQLKRLDAGYCTPKKGFDPAILAVELQGWFDLLHRR